MLERTAQLLQFLIRKPTFPRVLQPPDPFLPYPLLSSDPFQGYASLFGGDTSLIIADVSRMVEQANVAYVDQTGVFLSIKRIRIEAVRGAGGITWYVARSYI